MRLLGLDPGSHMPGYGVIDTHGHSLKYIAAGTLQIETDDFEARLISLFNDTQELLKTYQPDQVAMERVVIVKSANMLDVIEARGVQRLAVAQFCVPLHCYTPQQIKMTVSGNHLAKKPEMQAAVKDRLMLAAIVKPDDANDGLAAALTHYYQHLIGEDL